MSKVVTSTSRLSDIFLFSFCEIRDPRINIYFLDTLWKLFYNH